MGLANNQAMPAKKEEKQPWTRRQLFRARTAVLGILKVFNPYELLFVFLMKGFFVLILLNKRTPLLFWAVVIMVFLAGFFQRNAQDETDQTKKTKKDNAVCLPKKP